MSITNVLEESQYFIKHLQNLEKGSFLIRGVTDQNVDIKKKSLSIKNRVPKNVSQKIHDRLNEKYTKIYGWPVRNGLFTYGVKSDYDNIRDLGYGKTHLLFPCGQFQYVYDLNIFDLAAEHYKYCKQKGGEYINEFLKTVEYVNKDLIAAMSKIVFENQRSVEIIINCDEYYLINTKYAPELIKQIWG